MTKLKDMSAKQRDKLMKSPRWKIMEKAVRMASIELARK